MNVTELPNARIEKGHQPEELRFIFWGRVEKEAYDYYEFIDFTDPNRRLTPKEFAAIQKKSKAAPVRINYCRFLYQKRFFKSSTDTDDMDLILGAIIEKDRRKAAREEKLRKVGRDARNNSK